MLYLTSGNTLATFDVLTSVTTVIGSYVPPVPGGFFSDIALIPAGQMYGLDGTGSGLWQINPATAAITFIGNTTAGSNSLVSDSSGVLYNVSGGSLYTVDKTTAVATLLGALPGSPADAGDLAFIGENLYLTTFANTLYKIDVTDPTNPAKNYTVGTTLPDSFVRGLAELYFNGTQHLYGAVSLNVFEISTQTGQTFNQLTVPNFDGSGFINGMTSTTWAMQPDVICFEGNLNMNFNTIENANSIQVDNLSTTSQFPTGAINVHNDLNIFNSPPGGGHITFTGEIQIGDSTTNASGTNSIAHGKGAIANVTNGIAIGTGATTNTVAGSIAIGPSAGTVGLNTSHPLALTVNSAGVTASVVTQSSHTLGIVINNVQYRILLITP